MRQIAALLFILAVFCFVPVAHSQTNSLVLAQTIAFPDLQGGFNHMSVDADHRRLFAAAPANNTLEIVDLSSGRPWRSLKGERPAAVRYAPEFNQLYVSRDQNVYVYDTRTFDLIGRVDLQSRLDELQYDAAAKELYVGCMTPVSAVAVIAIPEGRLKGKIPLPGRPQGIAVEREGTRIFANVPSLGQVAVMDRRKRELLPAWPLRDVKDNTPIALDEAHHRLFLGGREPARLVVLDSLTGRSVTDVPIDGIADDMFWDPARGRIFISCGEGFIDVLEQQDSDHYRLLDRVATADGAATSTFSAQLGSVYVGVPRRGNEPAEIRIFKAGR